MTAANNHSTDSQAPITAVCQYSKPTLDPGRLKMSAGRGLQQGTQHRPA